MADGKQKENNKTTPLLVLLFIRIKRTRKKQNTFSPGVLIRKRTPHIYYFTATTYLFQ